jgi:16S rRNA (adenine1518-N6/adenine1519-N6)-dimethyltransferase
VLEIGPGGGVLTRELLAAGASVLAWELDPAWAAAAAGALPGGNDRLQVVVGDALDIPFERLPPGTLAAGNLPYNVATLDPHCPAAARTTKRVPRAASCSSSR